VVPTQAGLHDDGEEICWKRGGRISGE
jgi:hypothetical protein